MGKVLKNILFSFLFLLVFISLPTKVLAERTTFTSQMFDVSKENNYITEENTLLFQNIIFYKSESNNEFGIKGKLFAFDNYYGNIEVIINYYNSNNEIIANHIEPSQGLNIYSATIRDDNEPFHYSFNYDSNLTEIKNGYSVNDIKYYDIKLSHTVDFYSYIIKDYNIDILVKENNTLEITEKLSVDFNASKHGIIRKIPTINKVKREDGTESTVIASISNIKVNKEFDVNTTGDYKEIIIGNKDETVRGNRLYEIKYLYNLGKDTLIDKDEFYFNIIGKDWDTKIENMNFKITMPSDFDESKMGFSPASYLVNDITKDSSMNSVYQVNKNVITGKFGRPIKSGNAYTIRIELPEGYFSKSTYAYNNLFFTVIFICIAFIGFAYLIWYNFGRDDMVVETVEFYPPEGIDSLNLGYLYKGYLDIKDITSLLIYLASKGYLSIEEYTVKEFMMTAEKAKFTKLKDYNEDNEFVAFFFNELFRKGTINNLNYIEVTTDDLKYNFSSTTNFILNKSKKKAFRKKAFESNFKLKSVMVGILMVIVPIMVTYIPVYLYEGTGTALSVLIQTALFFPLLAELLFSNNTIANINGKNINSPILAKISVFIGFVILGFIPWRDNLLGYLQINNIHMITFVIGVITFGILGIIFKELPKRNQYGIDMLGKIRGFKSFLETVEKEKLEALVEENPSYFYDILPYTYVLGISNLWISKFEFIALQCPTWYVNGAGFTSASMGHLMNNTLANTESLMSPSTGGGSFGSGSSGGGFSGGGSGGGGGSSW